MTSKRTENAGLEMKKNCSGWLWPLTCNLSVIFVVAVALNLVWELGQAFLYVGMNYNLAMIVHCFWASLGDGLILWVIYLIGLLIFRNIRWFVHPSASRYAVMLIAGLIISIIVEWIGLDVLKRWAYTDSMPIVPLLNIGLLPVLQMLLLPPVIFAVVAALQTCSRREPDGS